MKNAQHMICDALEEGSMCTKKHLHKNKTDHQSLWWNDDQSSKFVPIPNTTYSWVPEEFCEDHHLGAGEVESRVGCRDRENCDPVLVPELKSLNQEIPLLRRRAALNSDVLELLGTQNENFDNIMNNEIPLLGRRATLNSDVLELLRT